MVDVSSLPVELVMLIGKLRMPAWLAWTSLALATWGIWGVLSEACGNSLSGAHCQIVSTVGMLPVLGIMRVPHQPVVSNDLWLGRGWAFLAGLVSGLGNVFFFGVLQQQGAKAANVIPLTSLAPLVTVLLAIPILGERLNAIQISGVFGALVAIYLFNVPTEQSYLTPWVLAALLPILLWGVAGLLQKMATNFLPSTMAMRWFLGAFALLGGLLSLCYGIPISISWQLAIVTLLMGFCLALGNLAILLAFASDGKASIISPLCGMYPAVSLPLAMIFLGETVTLREWLAIGIALVAVLAMALERPATSTHPTLSATPLHPGAS